MMQHTDEEKEQIEPTRDFPTVIQGTNCSGSEQRLAECDFHFTPAYSCILHKEDVTLTCLGEPTHPIQPRLQAPLSYHK